MNAMIKGAAMAAAIAVCAGFAAGAQAAQVFRDVGQVGQWKIQSGSENGKFLYCRAIGRASNGELALVQWADGKWRLSMADFGLPPGRKFNGMMELRRASIPFELVSNKPGLREAISLNAALLDGVRTGGYIQLQVGGKTFTMQMENNAEAIRAVGDCRSAGLRGGVQPVAAGGGNQGGRFIVSRASGKCIDVAGAPGQNNGAALQLWDCERAGRTPNGAPTDQRWTINPQGFIVNTVSRKCIDVLGAPGIANGAKLALWDCESSGRNPNGSTTDQQWEVLPSGLIRNRLSGKCIDVPGREGRNNGARLQLWDCEVAGGPSDQYWRFEN